MMEDRFLGGVSASSNAGSHRSVLQAVGLALANIFDLLAACQTRVIRATENCKLGNFAATGGIARFYLVAMVIRSVYALSPLAGPQIHADCLCAGLRRLGLDGSTLSVRSPSQKHARVKKARTRRGLAGFGKVAPRSQKAQARAGCGAG